MTNFSTNQVTQFYVHDADKEVSLTVGDKIAGRGVSLQYNVDGELQRTDILENVEYITLTAAADMAIPTKTATVAVASGVTLPRGETFVVRVSYPEVAGLGIEGWTTKTVASNKTVAADLYSEIVDLLNETFESDGMLVASEDTDENDQVIGVVISCTDRSKSYKRGVRPLKAIDFRVNTNLVVIDGEDVDWASVTEGSGVAIPAVYGLMDLEYFAMGERGDQYRNVDYINAIDTNYLVTKDDEYAVLNIHYAYKGYNQNSHKSEKDIVIVGPNDESELSDLKDAIEVALGMKEAESNEEVQGSDN